jgi:hypothetical protein
MTRIRIHGINSPQTEREVEQLIGGRPFVQGTDKARVMEFYHRSDAQMAVMALQNLGLRVSIDGDYQASS